MLKSGSQARELLLALRGLGQKPRVLGVSAQGWRFALSVQSLANVGPAITRSCFRSWLQWCRGGFGLRAQKPWPNMTPHSRGDWSSDMSASSCSGNECPAITGVRSGDAHATLRSLHSIFKIEKENLMSDCTSIFVLCLASVGCWVGWLVLVLGVGCFGSGPVGKRVQGLYDRLFCISPHRCQGFSPAWFLPGLYRCGFLDYTGPPLLLRQMVGDCTKYLVPW